MTNWIKCSEKLPETIRPTENTSFEISEKVWIVYTKRGEADYFYSTATLFMYESEGRWKIDDMDPWSEIGEVLAWIKLPKNYEEIRN